MSGLVGELTPERLRQWSAENAGRPNAGTARLRIKEHLKGRASLNDVLRAVAEYERLSGAREARHDSQVWVSPRFPLEDGRVYEGVSVWQPGKGDFTLARVRFVEAAPRGQALYHVMSKEPGAEFSHKRGSFMEV